MTPARIQQLLERVARGESTVDSALAELRNLPFADLGFATVDHHRALRQGVSEVILGEGKTTEQIIGIAGELSRGGHNVLVTRLEATAAAEVQRAIPSAKYVPLARTLSVEVSPIEAISADTVALVSAGTSDLPVAEECAETMRMLGVRFERVIDVGVAGIHRLLHRRETIDRARVAIVVAGMEGALASVVGGLIEAPVIAVPTSVGYGASFKGLAALLGHAHELRVEGRHRREHRQWVRRGFRGGAHRAAPPRGGRRLGHEGSGARPRARAPRHRHGAPADARGAFGRGVCSRGVRQRARSCSSRCPERHRGRHDHRGARRPRRPARRARRAACEQPASGRQLPRPLRRTRTVRQHRPRRISTSTSPRANASRTFATIREHSREARRSMTGVRARATRTFERLAEAEASVHRMSKDDVHYHEVGAVDAIVDIVGAAAALEYVGAADIVCSPLPMGRGMVEGRSRRAPACRRPQWSTVCGAFPTYDAGIEAKLVTPTGAAIIAVERDARPGCWPVHVTGGDRDGAQARSTSPIARTCFACDPRKAHPTLAVAHGTHVVLEANLDDATGRARRRALIARPSSAKARSTRGPRPSRRRGSPGVMLGVLCAACDRRQRSRRSFSADDDARREAHRGEPHRTAEAVPLHGGDAHTGSFR